MNHGRARGLKEQKALGITNGGTSLKHFPLVKLLKKLILSSLDSQDSYGKQQHTATAAVFFFKTTGTGTSALPFEVLPCRAPNEQGLSRFMPHCQVNPLGDET